MTINLLEWIDVGQVSAERDDNLIHYFYDAGISKRIIENPKQFLLLGRKGAGKSALFGFLQKRGKNIFTSKDLIIPLSLASYEWNAHFLLSDPRKIPGAAQRDSWRLVIAIETIKSLFEFYEKKGKSKIPSSITEAKGCLEAIFTKPVPSWFELLGEKLFRLSKAKLPQGKIDPTKISGELGEITFEEIKTDSSLRAQLSKNIENLTAYLEDKIGKGIKDRRVFLLFDKLDESWVEGSISQCKDVITGLINASEYILQEFNGRIRPVVFLREDIFQTLELNDKNKLKEDCGSLLQWDANSLLQMLKARIDWYAKSHSQTPPSDLADLFNVRTMRSRTTPLNYVLSRSFYRPRDLVAYFRKIIDDAKGTNPTEKFIPTESIYNTEATYSEYLYGELIDEWKTQTPEIVAYLEVLENIGTSIISSDDLSKSFSEKMGMSEKVKIRNILRFLFENSIIGYRVGQSNQWKYKSTNPTLAFTDADSYRVHPGLKKRLGLKDTSSTDNDEEQ